VLNGLFGDRLAAMGNPLAITMRVRQDGVAVPIERDALASAFAKTDGIVVLLHGLCMNDLAWSREGHDHGASLARDEGFAPVYVHYNTGQSLANNGRELDRLLEALVAAWPHPIRRFAIVGHSMGGLVARAACEVASRRSHSWLERLDSMVFVGTPHRGAPLERAGAWVDYLVGISPYTAPFARLGRLRSAGIQDLRHGPRGALAVPATVRAYAIAASLQPCAGKPGARVRGDGLVPVSSALGVNVPAARRWVAHGTGHLGLLSSQPVYEQMRSWLGR
jgi:pimeloyl-ACP methyl ester carboxylesterase